MATTSDDIDTSQRRRRHFRWLAALVVLVAAGLVAVALRGVGASDPSVAAGDRPADSDHADHADLSLTDAEVAALPLPEQLAYHVVEALEQASPEDHQDHGHYLREGAYHWVCAAETFGFTPAAADTADDVDEVYVHYMCAEVNAGFPWPTAIRASGPAAVEFTDPPTVSIPEEALAGEEGVNYADRIRATIPEEYHAEALAYEGRVPDAVMDTLQERFEAASS